MDEKLRRLLVQLDIDLLYAQAYRDDEDWGNLVEEINDGVAAIIKDFTPKQAEDAIEELGDELDFPSGVRSLLSDFLKHIIDETIH